MSGELIVRNEKNAHRLVLTRPERGNALSAGMVEAMHDALDRADRGGARLLVIQGEGRNFCTGFDLSDLDRATDADLLARFVRIELLLARLWSAPYATLAIARGNALGAGADLFTTCARRVALSGSRFGFPGAAFGLVLGTRRLAERIGADRAQELIASGKTIDAETACRFGLATDIVEEAELGGVLESVSASAGRLEAPTFAAIRKVLAQNDTGLDADLAHLVRSAARPGLRRRIADYRDRAVATRAAAQRKTEQA